MAQMNIGKFDNIYKLLSDHNFTTKTNIPDELKCTKCKNILVDACQVSCGCLYCCHCIDEMVENGTQFCPESTPFCKDKQISNYRTDHRSNRKILQFVVKCPEELCPHECELINMEEHLRLCSNKCVPCPFYGFGCEDDKLIGNRMVDHLQLEGFNHNKILIELIENLRNEVNVLKESNEANKKEIQSHKSQIGILQENSLIKDQTISVMQQQIRSIQEENQQMAAQINNLKLQSDNKIANLTQEMTKEWRDNLGTEVMKMNDDMEKCQLQLTKRTDKVEKWQDKQIDGTIVMKVDKISDIRKKFAWICSPIFYLRISPYKMQLAIWNNAGSDKLYIRLFIHAGKMDAGIKWHS